MPVSYAAALTRGRVTSTKQTTHSLFQSEAKRASQVRKKNVHRINGVYYRLKYSLEGWREEADRLDYEYFQDQSDIEIQEQIRQNMEQQRKIESQIKSVGYLRRGLLQPRDVENLMGLSNMLFETHEERRVFFAFCNTWSATGLPRCSTEIPPLVDAKNSPVELYSTGLLFAPTFDDEVVDFTHLEANAKLVFEVYSSSALEHWFVGFQELASRNKNFSDLYPDERTFILHMSRHLFH